MRRRCLGILLLFVMLGLAIGGRAQMPTPNTSVGFPQDAGPHDSSVIEWWYFNAFLTSASGHHYAVVGSFFRSGLTPDKKGHYLIYSLADLDDKSRTAYSILDQSSIKLLKVYLLLAANQHPDDPEPMKMLGMLQKNELPKPHRTLKEPATVTTKPLFSVSMGKDKIAEATPDGRTWKVALNGDDFTLDLNLVQPTRPAMLVGGSGKTGVSQPDDMYYLSLTHMDATGTLNRGGKPEAVTGLGWLDRQWGRTWGVQRNVGWDWFGLHLGDGSDIIIYRLRDTTTGKTLQQVATRIDSSGAQTTETPLVQPDAGATYTDPATKILYPAAFTISLPKSGITLKVAPAFSAQTIPVMTGGDAIWEGVVSVKGTYPDGKAVGGQGYMELVGYKPAH